MSWEPISLMNGAQGLTKDVEADDPLELIGTNFPSTPHIDAATAQCIVEEYAMIGFNADAVRNLFLSPNYVALHSLYRRYGAQFVEDAIASVFVVKERA